MRGGTLGGGLRLAALAAASLGSSLGKVAVARSGYNLMADPLGPQPKRRPYSRYDRLPAGTNRHTGQPHKHEREASRRLRQECVAELNRANRYLRAHGGLEIGFGDPLPEFGLTRSGRKVRL